MWLSLVLTVLAVSFSLMRIAGYKNVLPAVGVVAPTNQISIRIFAQSPRGRELLFSRFPGDLWLRYTNGLERRVASNVIRATFSPDGQKFAYSTKDDDLFVESLDGQQLAQLAHARDYAWLSNSMAITFSAIAAAEYPEFEQIVVYEIHSNQTRFLPIGE